MLRRPPRSKRTDTLFPDTPLFRSETLRDGLVAIGAVTRREDLATTSGLPRYALKADFAALFDPALQGTDLEATIRSEEHTSELQSLMRNSYAVFCLKTKNSTSIIPTTIPHTTHTYKHKNTKT